MHPGRLSLFLLVTLIFPIHQVVSPQRDLNAEETVAANFLRMRREAHLVPLTRVEGSSFSLAACEAAGHGSPEKVWVENANYAAMLYSTPRADAVDAINSMAIRVWKTDERFVVGACSANTPAFPAGRYWIAVGVIGTTTDKSVAELLSGRAVSAKVHPTNVAQTGE